MHVLILGAGAMGSLLGARLSRGDVRVTLLSRDSEHIAAVRHHGLTVEELDGRKTRYHLAGCTDPRDVGRHTDLVVVLVKSYGTRDAVASVLKCCHDATFFLTLQNGIGHWEQIARCVGVKSVVVGTTTQGATLIEPGVVRHGGNGPTYLGEINGVLSDRIQQLVAVFSRAGLEVHATTRVEELIWKKLLVNVGINAITALTGIANGLVNTLESARALSRAAVEEAMQVARAKGIPVAEDMVDQVLTIAQATASNRSSMGQDVDRRRRTEIDAINGAIIRYGAELGVATPVNWVLTQLIKTLETAFA